MSKKKSVAGKIARSILCILLVLLLVVAGYCAYVLLSYSRIEDGLSLEAVRSENTRAQATTGTTYTVVTQNIGFGAYTQDFTFFMDGGTQSRAASAESVRDCVSRASAQVRSAQPDFAFFQEVDFGSTRSHQVDEREMLAADFAAYDSIFAVNYHSAYLMYPIFEPHGKSNSGMMTFSAFTVRSAVRRSLPISTGLSKLLDLDRCYTVSRVDTDNGKQLVLYNVHLSAYGGSDEIRTAQMTMLFEDMKAEYDKGNYAVCGGDFNHDFTGNSSQELNGKDADFGWAMPFPADLLPDGITRATNYASGIQEPTCRNCDVPYVKGNFTIIVDGFLVSDNVTVEYLQNVQTEFVYSDHNPVVMKFSLNA